MSCNKYQGLLKKLEPQAQSSLKKSKLSETMKKIIRIIRIIRIKEIIRIKNQNLIYIQHIID